MNYEKRLEEARGAMERLGIDGLFLTPGGDMAYLLGVSRGRVNPTHHHLRGDWLDGFLVTRDEVIYMVPEMLSAFLVPAAADNHLITDVIVMDVKRPLEDQARDVVGRLGLDKGCTAVPKGALAKTVIYFHRFFPEMQIRCTEEFTCEMRMIKDADEIRAMRRASERTDELFARVLGKLKAGMSEIEIESELDLQMRSLGASGNSFPSGAMVQGNGVKVRGLGGGSERRLENGCSIAFDFGMVLGGYCSDFGRSVYVGGVTRSQDAMHRAVHEAQAAAFEALDESMRCSGGISAEGLNAIAHDSIDAAGYEGRFFHRLGHGIGLDVHEYPYLDAGYTELLRPGMTFTVEPSIFIPGEALIRVEDVVLLTEKGAEVLNRSGKEPFVV